MAEIKIEKKKPFWAWVVLALVILSIIAYIVYIYQGNKNTNDGLGNEYSNEPIIESTNNPMNTKSTKGTAYMPGTSYDQYTAFEGSIKDSTRIATDSSYTKKAYYNLCKAVAKKAEETNVADSQALTDLKNFSMLITKVSSPLGNAESAKNFKTASDKVAKVLEDIQIKSYPGLQSQVSDLKQVTSKMDGYVRMDKQQANITEFLQKSRDILKEMNK